VKIRFKYILFLCLLAMASESAIAQTENYNQFWNQYTFTRNLTKKWRLEANLGLSTSSVPEENNPFNSLNQFSVRLWAHYYPSNRWKLSYAYAYYYNRDVPELNQLKTSEFRSSLQATYYILRGRNKLNTRLRIEDRHLENEDHYFESVYRMRLQLKYLYPITAPKINKNVLYVFASDEVFFKGKSNISGTEFFDRNRAILGLGYSLHNNMQVELAYANEVLPRTEVTKVYHAFQAEIIFTDFLSTVNKLFKKKEPVPAPVVPAKPEPKPVPKEEPKEEPAPQPVIPDNNETY
jgi:hypothetical protein